MGAQQITGRHVGVVVACCVQCGIPVAMIISTPGIFYPVMAEDFGVQTAEVSAWMSIAMLSSAAFSPLVGNLLGRFRLRTMRLSAVALAGTLLLAFSLAPAPWVLWVAAVGMGYCLVLLTSLGPATLVNRWFQERVGALLGLCAAFTAIGGVVFLMLGQAVIDAAGWRAAYLAFALLTWAVGLPVEALACRERPAECGLLPYGAACGPETAGAPEAACGPGAAHGPATAGDGLETAGEGHLRVVPAEGGRAAGDAASPAGRKPGETPAAAILSAEDDAQASRETPGGSPGAGEEAVRMRARLATRTAPFWLLICCGFLMNFVCQVNGYFPKYVMWLDAQAAVGLAGAFVSGAVLASVCQAGSAVGKIGLGAFSDVSVRVACVVLAACGAAGIACVWQAAATPLLVAGGFSFGFFIAGVLVLVPMLCRRIFGSGEVYPLVYSRVAVAPTLGGAAGNILWPLLADGAAGFDAVFAGAILAIGVVLITALAALRIGDASARKQR